MDLSLPSFDLKVDRSRAVVRALWRLLCVAVMVGLLLQVRPNWRLLWLTEPASYLALGVLLVSLGAVALILLVAAVRWLLLAAWPGPLGVRVTPRSVVLDLGPLGRRSHDWRELVVEVAQEFDRDILDDLPDDSIVLRIHCRGAKEDLAHLVQIATNLDDETMTRLFRPFLGRTPDESTDATPGA